MSMQNVSAYHDMSEFNQILCISEGFYNKFPTNEMSEYLKRIQVSKTTEKRKKYYEFMYEYIFALEMTRKKSIVNKTLAEVIFSYYRYHKGGENIYMHHESLDFNNLIKFGKLDKKRWMTLITAYCQSGKTFLIIALLAMYLSIGITPILIVKDKGNMRQVMSRVKADFKELVKFIKEYGYTEECNMFESILYHDSNSKKSVATSAKSYFADKELKPALSGNENSQRLILCIKQETHLKRIVESLSPLSTFALFIDEAHILGGYKQVGNGSGKDMHDSGIGYECFLFRLKDSLNCKKLVEITATSQSILVSNPNLYAKGILHIEVEKHHRNLKDVIFHTEYHENDDSCGGDEEEEEEDSYQWTLSMKSFLFDKSMSPPYDRTNKFGKDDKLAIHALIKHERLNDEQHKLLEAFKDDATPSDDCHFAIINAKWVAMTIQSEGTRIYHSSLKGKTITIGNETVKDNNGEFLFKDVEICDVWQFLEINGGVERFPRRVVIAYGCAEEGITFAGYYSVDPNVDKNLHLTDIYISMNSSSPGCRLRQSIERGSGNHGDDMKINVYCSEKNKMKWVKTVELHDRQIDYLRVLARNGDEQVRKAVSEQLIFENRVPKKYIKIANGGKSLNKIHNPNSKDEDETLKILTTGINALNILNDEKYVIPVLDDSQIKKQTERETKRCETAGELEQKYFEKLEEWKLHGDDEIEYIIEDDKIYAVDPDRLTGVHAKIVSETIDVISTSSVWVSRSSVIDKLSGKYLKNTIRAYLTRIQQNLPLVNTPQPGLNFRLNNDKSIDLMYKD